MKSPQLIETCLEAGPMTEREIADALAGTRERKEMQAVMSLIECFIAQAHEECRVRGQAENIRTEAAGAARYLIELRLEMIAKATDKVPDTEETSAE
jgi:hypothetical protein